MYYVRKISQVIPVSKEQPCCLKWVCVLRVCVCVCVCCVSHSKYSTIPELGIIQRWVPHVHYKAVEMRRTSLTTSLDLPSSHIMRGNPLTSSQESPPWHGHLLSPFWFLRRTQSAEHSESGFAAPMSRPGRSSTPCLCHAAVRVGKHDHYHSFGYHNMTITDV